MKNIENNSVIITPVNVNDIPHWRSNKSSKAAEIVRTFSQSEEMAIKAECAPQCACSPSYLNSFATLLRAAVRMDGLQDKIIITKRGDSVYLIKKEGEAK